MPENPKGILNDYHRKRKFDQTPEPRGDRVPGKGPLRFVVQMHAASRLHYDFRIEVEGVLKSWAIPKGPSLNPQDQRLAVFVEDHPMAYGSFEGTIPKGNYGAGTVMLWDEGTYLERQSQGREESEKAVVQGLQEGHVTLVLQGHKLQGEFALIRLKGRSRPSSRSSLRASGEPSSQESKAWLLIKKRDEFAAYRDITREDLSVKTGRTIQEIASQVPSPEGVWLPKRSPIDSPARRSKSVSAKPSPGMPLPKTARSSRRESLPRRIKPMLPTEGTVPFDQKGWLFELDRAGYRAIAEVDRGVVRLYSKQNISFNERFPEIVAALSRAGISAVLDGEIVKAGEGESEKSAVYWIRDLLHLQGEDLRNLPLLDRKQKLHQLEIFGKAVRYCSHELTQGTALFHKAVEEGFRGIWARDAYSTYRSGTSKRWLKISATNSGLSDGISDPAADAGRGPRLSNLSKIYWPEEKITKGDLLEYYRRIAPFLLPHLKDRPESLHRFPDGIKGQGFFQKDLLGHHPRWVHTERVFSESSGKSIDYLLCQNEWTLLYMANMGCIELNPWLSRIKTLDRPDWAVIDLDPDDNDFSEVVRVALEVHRILEKIGAFHLCKTSGATGLHIYLPLQARVDYETARNFALAVCRKVHARFPELTSLERSPAKRRGKIYLDCFQNAQGQTVASVYSVRPRAGATVSAPLRWEEVTLELHPESFTIHTVPDRVEKLGDLWQPVLEKRVDVEDSLRRLAKLSDTASTPNSRLR